MQPAKKPILTRSAFFLPVSLLALLLAAMPLEILFTSQHGIATLGDDSVSYLILARHFAGSDGPLVAAWLGFQAHFPPLFPMVLALAGGAQDFQRAHLVVAVFAALALVPVCLYAARELGRQEAGILVALLFLLTPSAWISIKGILSESMYLFISMGAILYFGRRLEGGRIAARRWLVFGTLLACACLARAVGLALVIAYVAHASVRVSRERGARDFRLYLPLVPVLAIVGAWFAFRPAANTYQQTFAAVAGSWIGNPLEVFLASAKFLYRGWIASFGAQADVAPVAQLAFASIGLLGVAGAVRRVLANRLDGWYVVLSLAIIFFWVFQEENMRRLLYPLLPLLLVYAAESLAALCRLCRLDRHEGRVLFVAWALAALLCLPAALAVLAKSRDPLPGIAGLPYSYADITDYYTTINTSRARAIAARQIAVLAGLEALEEATPPGSRIMWMRPDYIALLGKREGVPWLYRWDRQTLAREVRATGTAYLVVATLFKADLEGAEGDPFATLAGVDAYSQPVLGIRNVATGGDEFVLRKVDPVLLESFIKPD